MSTNLVFLCTNLVRCRTNLTKLHSTYMYTELLAAWVLGLWISHGRITFLCEVRQLQGTVPIRGRSRAAYAVLRGNICYFHPRSVAIGTSALRFGCRLVHQPWDLRSLWQPTRWSSWRQIWRPQERSVTMLLLELLLYYFSINIITVY